MRKRCIHNNCEILPCYNLPNEITPKFCKAHKLENMIDIINKNKKCIYNNCNIRANFNISTSKKALYCSEHKKENMIDIKSKRCIEPNCTR